MLRLALLLLPLLSFAAEQAVIDGFDSNNAQDGSLNTNTVDSTVSSNNQSEDRSVSNTYNGAGSSSDIPVGSAIAPSYMSNGIETCLQGRGSSLQTNILGFTRGSYAADEDCNRRRDSKVLSDLGMKVAAISRMCESLEVWRSMFLSGTPCPMLNASKLIVGKRAFLLMKRQPETYIPDYGRVKMLRRWDHDKDEWVVTPRYNKHQAWYNKLLANGDVDEGQNVDSGESVSARYRSSIK